MINASEAKALVAKENAVLVDVRSAREYQNGHIDGAVLAPIMQIFMGAESLLGEKDRTIIVYCETGSRSSMAAMVLRRKGYKNVYDLGGINNWPEPLV